MLSERLNPFDAARVGYLKPVIGQAGQLPDQAAQSGRLAAAGVQSRAGLIKLAILTDFRGTRRHAHRVIEGPADRSKSTQRLR
jgi:hypothetical protein